MNVTPNDLALQRLYHWESHRPDRVVLTQPMGGGKVHDYSWHALMDEARRVAAYLQRQGLQPGDRVAILSKNTAHWLMSDFAIWMAGGVSVPLYPTLNASTLTQILAHSDAKWVFVGKLDGWEAIRPGIPSGLPCISHPLAPQEARQAYPRWEDIVERTDPLAGSPVRGGDELATIMYTSGTTGMPKGVMHSFDTFAWGVRSGLQRVSALHEQARMLSYLPLAHVAERTLVEHGLLATGMRVFFAESLDTFAADLQRARPTAFFSVPRLWVKFQQGVHAKLPPAKLQRLLKLPWVGRIVRRKILKALGLDACEFAAGGAAPMPPDLLRWYSQLGLDIIEVYGMTENCGVSHSTLPGRQRPGTVGQPYEGVQSRLHPTDGEIQVKAPCLMLGYYREPELTRNALTDDGWLKTGDKGQLTPEGDLRITGRVKDLFKTTKGKYVAPAPIEDRLVMHPAIEAACVSGAQLNQPLALLMLNEGAQAALETPAARASLSASLADHVRTVNATLEPHEQLCCVVVTSQSWTVDNGLVTPTLKVRRAPMDERYGPHFEQWAAQGSLVVWSAD